VDEPRRGAHRGGFPILGIFPPYSSDLIPNASCCRVAQRARREGHFRTIRGRGRPLERNSEEHNPFIAPEEFLLNRIVQRQGAAPPWVEVQCELDAAVVAFRATLWRSWVRRAVRMLTLTRSQLPLADVRALRDVEWETREKSYHDSALAEVNSLVRKYNALAPYAVRRVYYVREVELAKIYQESGEEILQEIKGRLRGPGSRAKSNVKPSDDDEDAPMGAPAGDVGVLRLRDLFWQWFRRGT
jgi:DnaJ family protein C protein 28